MTYTLDTHHTGSPGWVAQIYKWHLLRWMAVATHNSRLPFMGSPSSSSSNMNSSCLVLGSLPACSQLFLPFPILDQDLSRQWYLVSLSGEFKQWISYIPHKMFLWPKTSGQFTADEQCHLMGSFLILFLSIHHFFPKAASSWAGAHH